MTPEERRKRNTASAARHRENRILDRIAGELAGAARCPWPVSGGKKCGGPLETVVGEFGRTVLTCSWCARRKAGVCRECPRPVYGTVGKALRCATHRDAAVRRSIRASEARHREERLEKSRAYYQNNEEVRRRRNEYKQQWRKANREKVLAQKRRYVDRHRNDPNSAYLTYQVKYRKKYRLQKRAMERDRLAAAPPERKTSPKCTRCGMATRWKPLHRGHAGKPWTVCTPCLFPCERKIRMRNRRRALARAKEWLASIPTPSKIKAPPAAAVRGPGWERMCVTPGCDIVVTHRKKKCTKCRERDRQLAEQQLAPTRGRGRRVDLEQARSVA